MAWPIPQAEPLSLLQNPARPSARREFPFLAAHATQCQSRRSQCRRAGQSPRFQPFALPVLSQLTVALSTARGVSSAVGEPVSLGVAVSSVGWKVAAISAARVARAIAVTVALSTARSVNSAVGQPVALDVATSSDGLESRRDFSCPRCTRNRRDCGAFHCADGVFGRRRASRARRGDMLGWLDSCPAFCCSRCPRKRRDRRRFLS